MTSSQLSEVPRVIAADSCMIRLLTEIATKSSGYIYFGVDKFGEEVAVKAETINAEHQQLRIQHETEVYKKLNGGCGIPQIKWYGCEKGYNFLAMERLGPSVKDLFKSCSRLFSIKTVVMLADQMVERLEFIHSKGYVHCNIQPDNFLMGMGQHSNKVYMIDFSNAKQWTLNDSMCERIGSSEYRTGTTRYESLSAFLGLEPSRRDDLISLGYVLLYLLRGSLPWQGVKAHTKKQKYERIFEMKRSTRVDVLCEGYPAELAVYMNYCRSLRHEELPDYKFLRQMLLNVFRWNCYKYDYVFDWQPCTDPNEKI